MAGINAATVKSKNLIIFASRICGKLITNVHFSEFRYLKS
jgi:hypothetical protein